MVFQKYIYIFHVVQVTDDVEPANEAITALMDAIEQTNTQHEVRRALDEKRNMDGTTVGNNSKAKFSMVLKLHTTIYCCFYLSETR